jgi:oligo-1,6-glucosidase
MHREVFAGRPPGLLNVGETPGCSVEEAVLYTDPSRGELDMVFQFEHVDLDSGPKGKWDVVPMTMLQLKQSLGRWQDGWPRSAGTASTSGTTTSRAASAVWLRRAGASGAVREGAGKRAAPAPRHSVRLPGRRARDEQRGLTRLDQLRDVESLNHYTSAVARGEDPADVIRALAYKGRDNARVPMSWDASRGAGFTTGTPGSSSTRCPAPSTPPPKSMTRTRSSRTIAGHRAAARRALRRARDVPDAPGDHEQLYCFERSMDDTRLLVVAKPVVRS